MSVVPAALDALVELVAVALPTVQLFDGPEAKWPEQEFVAVGLGPMDPDTRSTRTPAGPATTGESADITCLIRSWSGDTAIRDRRVRAYELLDLLTAAVDADNTLGGAVGQAEVADHTYIPGPGRRGVVVDVVFTVRVLAF